MKPHDAFISYLHDIIRNILMSVTIHDPFVRNLDIDDNLNRFLHPWIFIVPLPFFRYIESRLCNPKSSLFTYTYGIHNVIQQTWTAQGEVLHMRLPNRLLTLLQNPKTTEHHENRVSFRLVYCIRRFIFIHYQHHALFEPMYLQLLPLTKIPTLFSIQVLQEFSTHREFCAMQSPLVCSN